VPDVPHRLVGVGDPAGALAGRRGVEAPVVGQRQVADQRADLEVAVEGDVGALAGGDLRLLGRDELVDLRHRRVAVARVVGQLADQRGVPGLERVDVAAVELQIDDALEAGPRRIGGRHLGGEPGAVALQVDPRVVVGEHRATAIAAARDRRDIPSTQGRLHGAHSTAESPRVDAVVAPGVRRSRPPRNRARGPVSRGNNRGAGAARMAQARRRDPRAAHATRGRPWHRRCRARGDLATTGRSGMRVTRARLEENVTGPLIELREITRHYQMGEERIAALAGVGFQIARGEMVAIIGSSGSGKSTLLNILGCLDTPTSGHYRLDGKDVQDLSDDERARARNRQIGFVFQSFQLLPRSTAVKNVALPLVYRGVPARERLARATAALAKVGLAERTRHRPNQMSGGQRQRTAIARALVTEPSLLLCDEPTGNLDSNTSEDIMALFHALHAEGNTIVMVTHEPSIAARCQRAIRIADGKVVADGAGRDVAYAAVPR
jgi:putative ABC transport system ATP-binding protein